MPRRPLKQRYDEFCNDAEDLLRTAGLLEDEGQPTIYGWGFWQACEKLATLHFPEDYEHGAGPRGLIHGMYGAVDNNENGVSGARSIATVVKNIIKHRPPLDKRESKKSTSKSAQEVAMLTHSPFFEPTRKYSQQSDFVFVLMPFTESWSDRLWNEHLRPYLAVTAGERDLKVQRADDMYGQGVMEDVFEGLVRARLIVAECTGRNANVLYELGMAHALGKRTALLSQSEEDIPFDLRRFRFCIYQDNSSGYPKLKKFLREIVREVWQ